VIRPRLFMYFSHSNLFLSTAPLDINPFNTLNLALILF